MSIRVLTWNVSFGAMTGSDLDRSSLPLPQVCSRKFITDDKGLSVTQCLMNVVETIDSSVSSSPYDFVALQEASNWNIIFSKSIELQRMGGFIHHLGDLEDMATFYDKQKYILLAAKVGNLVPGNGRPYQILFLQNKQDNNYYIFINLHNGHGITKEVLEKRLSANLDRGIKPNINHLSFGKPNDIEEDISDIINGKDFKVIMAGDTNDHGRRNYWRELRPFSKTIFGNLQNLIVKSTIEPPKTCCAPINLKEKQVPIRRDIMADTMLGDYVIFSENLSVLVNNRVLETFNINAEVFPTSDHLPVEIVLSPVVPKFDSGDIKYKQKYLKYKQKYLKYKQKYLQYDIT